MRKKKGRTRHYKIISMADELVKIVSTNLKYF